MQAQRRTLAFREIVDIMPLAYAQRMLEEFTLGGIGLLYLFLNAHVHLFPKTGDRRHTRRVRLFHRLLYLLRIGVDNQSCSLCQTEDLPTFFKDMSERQEIQHAVVLIYRYTLVVGLHSGMILSTGQDNALRIACGTAGIENIGNIIHRRLCLKFLHLRLSGQIISQFQEIIEIHGIGIVRRHTDILIENDNSLKCAASCKNATSLVVLFLLSNEKETDTSIVYHKLYLLLRTCRIERNRHRTDTPCTEVAEHILHRILRENTQILLYLNP